MSYSIIAAIGREREIGIDGKIPWDLPHDRKRFRDLTKGHTVLMGRKTYESIVKVLGKPLPDRNNIILTTDPAFSASGCTVVHSIEEAFDFASNDDEIFIIGGEQIYNQTLNSADRMYLTIIDEKFPGADAHFPVFKIGDWKAVKSTVEPKSESSPHTCAFVIYERRRT